MYRAYPARVQMIKLKPFPKCNSISGHVKGYPCDCCKEEAVLKIVINKPGSIINGKKQKGKKKLIYLCEEHKNAFKEYIKYF